MFLNVSHYQHVGNVYIALDDQNRCVGLVRRVGNRMSRGRDSERLKRDLQGLQNERTQEVINHKN